MLALKKGMQDFFLSGSAFKMNFWESTTILRKHRYEQLQSKHPYVFQWKWYSYRRFKLKLYVWTGSFLAYFLIKLKVKPNFITLVYALMGIAGGILLAIPHRPAVYIAISFFYFRGILDWTDGIVARFSQQTSLDGAILDSYGSWVGWISLWTGMGFYLGHNTFQVFFYLTPLIPVLFAADLHSNARDTLLCQHLLRYKETEKKNNSLHTGYASGKAKIKKIKDFIDKVFEHNARTVDLVAFIILIESLSKIKVLWVFYVSFIVWQIIIFIVRVSLVVQGRWAQSELRNLQKDLYGQNYD